MKPGHWLARLFQERREDIAAIRRIMGDRLWLLEALERDRRG